MLTRAVPSDRHVTNVTLRRSGAMHDTADLPDIRAFVVLASCGSFAAAASQLRRDPTSLSRRLQSLEACLGVRLADRTTRSFALTEAGQAYLTRIRPVLSGLDAAHSEVLTFAVGTPRGRFRLALPGSFSRLWLEPILLDFLKAYPGITLDASHSNAFVDIVGQGFDAAVRVGELGDSRLIARKVATNRRLLCAAPAYLENRAALKRPEDLAGHACLCSTMQKAGSKWTFRHMSGETAFVTPNCYMSSDDDSLLLAAARTAMGLLHTTDWHVAPYIASGELVEVLCDWPVDDVGAIYVVTPPASGMPNKTRAFSDWMAEKLSRPPWQRRSMEE